MSCLELLLSILTEPASACHRASSSPRQVSALSAYLARLSKPGAQLLALITIGEVMPTRPLDCVILDGRSLRYETRTPGMRASPRYSPGDIASLLKGFRIERSFLPRHDVRE